MGSGGGNGGGGSSSGRATADDDDRLVIDENSSSGKRSAASAADGSLPPSAGTPDVKEDKTVDQPQAPPVKTERKKHPRFNGMSEEEVAKRRLPDLIKQDLDILIVSFEYFAFFPDISQCLFVLSKDHLNAAQI